MSVENLARRPSPWATNGNDRCTIGFRLMSGAHGRVLRSCELRIQSYNKRLLYDRFPTDVRSSRSCSSLLWTENPVIQQTIAVRSVSDWCPELTVVFFALVNWESSRTTNDCCTIGFRLISGAHGRVLRSCELRPIWGYILNWQNWRNAFCQRCWSKVRREISFRLECV